MKIRIIIDSIISRIALASAVTALGAATLGVTTLGAATLGVTTLGVTTLGITMPGGAAWADPGTYETPEAFVRQAFPDGAPDAHALWLRAPLRETVADILGHAPAPRVRYWRRDDRSAWILEEIGKTDPITAGVVVDGGAIDDVRVLVFRESRGWEVKYPFFTRQFQDARLTAGGNLDRSIDGITGATLSVRAMTRMARVALLLDAHAHGRTNDLAAADPHP